MPDIGLQSQSDIVNNLLPCLSFLNITVNAVLNKYFLQRSEMPLLMEFISLNLKFQLKQTQSLICRSLKHVIHIEKVRLIILNNCSIRGDTHFTICKCIEGINRFIGR